VDWPAWHERYATSPALAARLSLVRARIAACLDACRPGPLRLLSVCAGDGRDVLGVLAGHARAPDVTATLIECDADLVARGRVAAEALGLGGRVALVAGDATRAASYAGAVPADVVVFAGVLGNVWEADVPRAVACLGFLCAMGGHVVWTRHQRLAAGVRQTACIRTLLRRHAFAEASFDIWKPLIAAVSGVALGGGLEIALACDNIIAAELARFGLPEPRVGLMAAAGGVHRLPRSIPLHVALGMMLTGRHVPAAEAARWGLANEVVPAAAVLPAAERWAREILECSPTAVQATKQAALQGVGRPAAEAMSAPYPLVQKLFASDDVREGPLAFAEKRKPRWQSP
jgi:enoyl-CoA hydratase/carnithine racemase